MASLATSSRGSRPRRPGPLQRSRPDRHRAPGRGDGRGDILGRIGGQWWAALSTGGGFAAPTLWAAWADVTWDQVFVQDLTGDGRADLFARLGGGWYAAVSTGAAFVDTRQWAQWANVPWETVAAIDADGDRRVDVLGRLGGQWYVGRSNGATRQPRKRRGPTRRSALEGVSERTVLGLSGC